MDNVMLIKEKGQCCTECLRLNITLLVSRRVYNNTISHDLKWETREFKTFNCLAFDYNSFYGFCYAIGFKASQKSSSGAICMLSVNN